MSTRLPLKLAREPLIDAIVEVRFGPNTSIADWMPGYLYAVLEGAAQPTRLAAADIPEVIRKSDPAFQYAALHALEWENYVVSVGENNILINSKLPYRGWDDFLSHFRVLIEKVGSKAPNLPLIRFSTKYVNIIEAGTIEEQIASINMQLSLAAFDGFHTAVVQAHQRSGEFYHIISVATNVSAELNDNTVKSGIVLDVDSIFELASVNLGDYTGKISDKLNELRQENKACFFSMVSEPSLQKMGPTYE